MRGVDKQEIVSKKEPHWLNKNQISKSLRISTQAFDKWGVTPCARTKNEVFYEAADVLINRDENRDKQSRKANNLTDLILEDERARLTAAQADAQEMKNKITKRELAPVWLLTTAIAKAAAVAESILGSVKLKIKRELPHLKASELERIETEIIKAQQAICRAEIDFDDIETTKTNN